jgi:hypothetical protein
MGTRMRRRAFAHAPVAGLAAAACVTASLLAPTAADAATTPRTSGVSEYGTVAIAVNSRAGVSAQLRRAGVRVSAIRPATQRTRKRGKGRRKTAWTEISLPASGAQVGATATVGLRGGLTFKAGQKTLRLTALQARIGSRTTIVSASVDGQRTDIFVARHAPKRRTLDREAGTASLAASPLSLTRAGTRALRKRLRLRRLSAGRLGTIAAMARSEVPRTPTSPTGPSTPEPTTPGTPNTPADPTPGTPADPGTNPPHSGPVNEAPLFPRPATAVDVSDVKISWHPRDSWIRYLSSGPGSGDGIFLAGGATAQNATKSPCPDRPSTSDALLPYTFRFTPRESWYDPASGTAGINGLGGVRFVWSERAIDLEASDPEIEINGAQSRAVFRFNGTGNTPFPNQRAAVVDLAPGTPEVTNGGKTFTYSLMRGTLTQDGASVFAGFYEPGDPWGCVSVSFTTP